LLFRLHLPGLDGAIRFQSFVQHVQRCPKECLVEFGTDRSSVEIVFTRQRLAVWGNDPNALIRIFLLLHRAEEIPGVWRSAYLDEVDGDRHEVRRNLADDLVIGQRARTEPEPGPSALIQRLS
jgi:hypothetical protein